MSPVPPSPGQSGPGDLPPPTLVQDARGLAGLVRVLDEAAEIAVDTEADSLFSYRERVCLIQITACDQDFLVDPLAGIDLAPLGAVFADPARLKVFHDGEYDVLILRRDRGFQLRNLFDTRVAAATLGNRTPGLATVLQEHFGVALDKSMQRSNWRQRPLSDKQIRYARLDTHFLLRLMHAQRAELARTGRDVIVASECRRLEALEPPDNGFDADEFVRIKGARALSPIEGQVMRELYVLREQLAKESDQPPFRVMNNETLIALARRRPRWRAELTEVGGFSSKQARKFGDLVLKAVERAHELGPLRCLPMLPNRDGTGGFTEEEVELHDRLKNWRKDVAEKMGLDAAYVLNRHVLLRLVRERPVDRAAVEAVEGMHAWQVERLGADITALIARFEDERRRGTLKLPSRRRRQAQG